MDPYWEKNDPATLKRWRWQKQLAIPFAVLLAAFAVAAIIKGDGAVTIGLAVVAIVGALASLRPGGVWGTRPPNESAFQARRKGRDQ